MEVSERPVRPARKRHPHIHIIEPVHMDRVRPASLLRLEFLSPVPPGAKAFLRVKCSGGEERKLSLELSDQISLPHEIGEGQVDLQVIASSPSDLWVSNRITVHVDPNADPQAYETGRRIYCGAPWTKINIGKSNANPCCQLRRKFRNPYREDASDYDPWNSATMQRLRQALVRGSTRFCFKQCESLNNDNPRHTIQLMEHLAAHGRTRNVDEAKKAFLRGDTIVQNSPLVVKLTVNHFCNHACLFCSRDIRSSWKADEEIFSLLKRYLESGVTHISLSGGEPMVFLEEMSGKLYELGDGMRDAGLSITTNASLIPKSIELLASVGRLRLLVSMNAGTRETYKAVHRKDHFEKVIEGIRLLKARRAGKHLYIRLKMVMMHQNRHDIPAYVEIAKDLQVDEVRFANALLYERADMGLTDQLQAGSAEWRATEADLEWAAGELGEAGILCSYAGPGWKREDTPEALDPLLLDEDSE